MAKQKHPAQFVPGKIDKVLTTYAAKLPAPVPAPRRVRGSVLLADDPEAKDKHGAPIVSSRVYTFGSRDPQAHIPHLHRLRKVWKAGGNAAVLKYLKPYFEEATELVVTQIAADEARAQLAMVESWQQAEAVVTPDEEPSLEEKDAEARKYQRPLGE